MSYQDRHPPAGGGPALATGPAYAPSTRVVLPMQARFERLAFGPGGFAARPSPVCKWMDYGCHRVLLSRHDPPLRSARMAALVGAARPADTSATVCPRVPVHAVQRDRGEGAAGR